MFFGEPLHEKIESAHAALGADASAPTGPVFHQFFIADQSYDFVIRGVFEQAARGPILIQPSLGEATVQDFLELVLVEIVIPQVRGSLCLHRGIIRENPNVQGAISAFSMRHTKEHEACFDRLN